MNVCNFNPIKPTRAKGYNKHGQHMERTVVKILSGAYLGNVIPCDSHEDAIEIACYLSDIEGVCTAIKPPIYS